MTAQSMEALALGNEIRYAGAAFRRKVRALPYPEGYHLLAKTLLGDFDAGVGALPIERFLASAHRLGERKAQGILRRARVVRRNPRVRDLSDRERLRIAQELRKGWTR